MAQPLLSIESLRIESRDKRVRGDAPARPLVDDVSLSLARGEVLGLIGESGAGKSTVGLSAMGYSRPGCRITAGRVTFDGRDLATLSPTELRGLRGARIAYVAQSAAASLNPAMRLGHQVAEALVLHRGMGWKQAYRHAPHLFEELDLPSPGTFGERFPHQVSGGQLQRAMIAMAIACQPELLILDEPTTALDVTTQIEVLASVRAMLRKLGSAAIYITHDLPVIVQLADRLVVLRNGRLVEQGTTPALLEHPAEDYTRRLVATQSEASPRATAVAAGALRAVLSIRSINAGYRTLPHALRGVSLEINAGETLAIVGASGSGKSTLARVICGLLPQRSGAVELSGESLAPALRAREREQLRRVQMVYQMPDTALNPSHRVGRILARAVSFYFGGDARIVAARVAELLRMVGLPEAFATRKPGELSGGEKQRVCIARALAAKPELMICDEVTSALDPLVADEILSLLEGLQKRGDMTFLFITHDIGVVRRVATNVAVMKSGSVVANGRLAEIFSPPLLPHVELLLTSVPQMRQGWLEEILARREAGGGGR